MHYLLLISIVNICICSLFGYKIGPLVKNIGNQFSILDFPNSRKLHKSPLVRIGGLTIFITFTFFAFINFKFIHFSDFYHNVSTVNLILFLGGICYFLLGLHDDIYRSSPILRLIVQIFVAILITFSGINISFISIKLPFLQIINIDLPVFLVYLFTVLFIVGITNSINWLDGFDGLAAGYCSIISLGLALHMFSIGNFNGLIFFSILSGSIIGFLSRNLKPPFYIMGDCGSYFLGYCLSVGTLSFLNNNSDNSISIIYLMVLFSLPIFDMSFVILKRLINYSNPLKPDLNHVHHRLMKANFSYEQIILLIYSYSTFSTFVAFKFI